MKLGNSIFSPAPVGTVANRTSLECLIDSKIYYNNEYSYEKQIRKCAYLFLSFRTREVQNEQQWIHPIHPCIGDCRPDCGAFRRTTSRRTP